MNSVFTGKPLVFKSYVSASTKSVTAFFRQLLKDFFGEELLAFGEANVPDCLDTLIDLNTALFNAANSTAKTRVRLLPSQLADNRKKLRKAFFDKVQDEKRPPRGTKRAMPGESGQGGENAADQNVREEGAQDADRTEEAQGAGPAEEQEQDAVSAEEEENTANSAEEEPQNASLASARVNPRRQSTKRTAANVRTQSKRFRK